MEGRNKIQILSLSVLAVAMFSIAGSAQAETTVQGGFIDDDQHWVVASSPYIIEPGEKYPGGPVLNTVSMRKAVLTIDPGVVVKFKSGMKLKSSTGSIKANGTADSPIVFTAYNDSYAGDTNGDGESSSTPGFWDGLELSSVDDEISFAEIYYGEKCIRTNFTSITIESNTFKYCEEGVDIGPAFGGIIDSNTFEKNDIGLTVSVSDGVTISNNKFIDNTDYGIEMTGNISKVLDIKNNIFTGNDTAIWISTYPDALINNNDFYDNTSYAINNTRLAFKGKLFDPIDATDNWWGDPDGPYHEDSNTDTTGDVITDGITYDPWEGKQINNEEEESAEEEASDEGEEDESDDEGEVAGASTTNSGGGGSAVSALPAEIVQFYTQPEVLKEGERFKLIWQTEHADSVNISGLANVSLSGERELVAGIENEFEISARAPNGTTALKVSFSTHPRDPVIIVPGILGSYWGSSGKLELDPIMKTYDGLIAGLESVGYEKGKTLFPFPYAWWQDNRHTAKLLDKKVQEILSVCGCEEVDIIAHSMGGLISRYYIQKIDDKRVDQIIFLGTPHLGASKAYLAWEAGEFGPRAFDRAQSFLFNYWSKLRGYTSVASYIQNEIPSLEQLLPVYSYLTDYRTGKLYSYSECRSNKFRCNIFLENMNEVSMENFNNIQIHNLVNSDLDTIRALVIEQYDPGLFGNPDKWSHGVPINYPSDDGILYGAGDGTVPKESAVWIGGIEHNISEIHSKLPYGGQPEIVKILLNKKLTTPLEPSPALRIMFVAIKSPADIQITAPDGTVYGAGQTNEDGVYYSGTDDPEFITILDPAEGEYQLEVTGTGTGEFEVETAFISDDKDTSKSFAGEISPREKYIFSFDYSSDSESLSELDLADTHPPETEILVNSEELTDSSYIVPVSVDFEVSDNSEITKTEYSLDAGESWQIYSESVVFSQPGDYELLYRSEDEHGNREYANIVTVTVEEEQVFVEQKDQRREEENSLVSDDSVQSVSTPETGENKATTTDESVGESGEVLGVSTEPKEARGTDTKGKWLVVIISGVILLFALISIYLKRKKI